MSLQEINETGVPTLGRMRRRLFGISPEEAGFARRGFGDCAPDARRRLETIGGVFLRGYQAALEEVDGERLARRLNRTEAEYRGFAYEGAAMGLSLLDRLTPWNGVRWHAFAGGVGAQHIYMVHVGLGWAFARLRRKIVPHLRRLDSLLCWLAVDGYGFHEGYFHARRYAEGRAASRAVRGYARNAFDQGLGRSLWFSGGADVNKIASSVARFAPERRGDLWSGVGLACAYAGGADRARTETLRELAGRYRAHLAQGAAFAAKTRQRAGNPTPHTELACRVICGLSADAAAEVTDLHLTDLRDEGPTPAYERWRQRIRNSFIPEVVRA